MASDIGILTNALEGTYGVAALNSKSAIEDLTLIEVFSANKELADAAAATASTLYQLKVPYAFVVEQMSVCPGAALTADATNNAVLTLAKANGAGGASTAIATLTTDVAGGNWVADVFKEGTVTGSAAAVADGQLLTLKITKGGTGVVVPACSVSIRVRKV
jgi:hypothetical protein